MRKKIELIKKLIREIKNNPKEMKKLNKWLKGNTKQGEVKG